MTVKRNLLNGAITAFDRLDAALDMLRAEPAPPPAPKRILVWTVDRLGDVVRTTPAIRALAARWPDARIEVVAAARASGVFVDHPQVSALHVIRAPHDLGQHRALARKLRGQHYDLGLLAEVEPAWAKLGQMFMRRMGVPVWARFDLGLRPLKRERVTTIVSELSWSELFRDLAVALGGKDQGAETALHVSDEARTEATQALQAAGLSQKEGFIVCHPGTSALVIDRAWSADRYAAALDRLHDAFGLPVVVTGLAAETPLARAIITECTRAKVHDYTAKLSFAGLTGVLGQARLTLINDTGPMHVSNALGMPTVVILGPTAPQVLGITPAVTTLVRAGLPCQPCAWHTGLKACTNPVAYKCLTAVTVDQVVAAASAHLRGEVAPVDNPPRRVKVAHVVELSRGGPTTAVLQLLRHQSESPDYDQPALIACRNLLSDELAAFSQETHLYTSSRNPLKFRAVAAEVGALLDQIKPDVVHLHSTFPGVYGRLALRGKADRPKVIYCPHGWSFAQEAPFLKKWIYGRVERALLPQTDAILNISAHEEALARRWRVKTDGDALVRHGISGSTATQVADLDLDPNKINIGFIGRLDRQKGLDLLLDALRKKPRPWLALTVIGARLRDSDTADFAAAGIRQIDWVPYADIDGYIAAFDAMIMPSRWEGFSYTPLEAMRNGKPILVSNRTSLPEVVIDGFNGLVFDLDTPGALGRALDQLAVLDLPAMGRNARLVFERTYSEPPVLAALDQFYANVVAGNRSPLSGAKQQRTL